MTQAESLYERLRLRWALVAILPTAIAIGLLGAYFIALTSVPNTPSIVGEAYAYVGLPDATVQFKVTFDHVLETHPHAFLDLALGGLQPGQEVSWAIALTGDARLIERPGPLYPGIRGVHNLAVHDVRAPLVSGLPARPLQVLTGRCTANEGGYCPDEFAHGDLDSSPSTHTRTRFVIVLPLYGKVVGPPNLGVPGPWYVSQMFGVDVNLKGLDPLIRLDSVSPSLPDPGILRWTNDFRLQPRVAATDTQAEEAAARRIFGVGIAAGVVSSMALGLISIVVSSLLRRRAREASNGRGDDDTGGRTEEPRPFGSGTKGSFPSDESPPTATEGGVPSPRPSTRPEPVDDLAMTGGEGRPATPVPESIIIQLNEANIEHGHFYLRSENLPFFPDDAVGGSSKATAAKPITLRVAGLPDPVNTDIDGKKKFFRNRAFAAAFIRTHRLRAGDRIRITRIGAREYRVEPLRED